MTRDEQVIPLSPRLHIRLARIRVRGCEVVQVGAWRLADGGVARPTQQRPLRLSGEAALALGTALLELGSSVQRAEADARAGRRQFQEAFWAPAEPTR